MAPVGLWSEEMIWQVLVIFLAEPSNTDRIAFEYMNSRC
jgi:hypothetical protein